jgi:hypothetical protein
MKLIYAPDNNKNNINKLTLPFDLKNKDIINAEILVITTLKLDIEWKPSSIFKQKLIERLSSSSVKYTRSNRSESERKRIFNYIDNAVMIYFGLTDVQIDSLLKLIGITLVTIILETTVNEHNQIQSKNSPQSTAVKYIPMKNKRPYPGGISLLNDFNEADSPIELKECNRVIDKSSLLMSLLLIDFHQNKETCKGALNIIDVIFQSIKFSIIDKDEDNNHNHDDNFIYKLKRLSHDELSNIENIIKKSITLKFEEWR